MKLHELKTWPYFFQQVSEGAKTFELRKNDRDFKRGDILWLREYTKTSVGGYYTGKSVVVKVTYIIDSSEGVDLSGLGLVPGFCIMSIVKI